MPSTYTPNLGVEKPEDGEQDGIWGDVVNLNMDILDRAINGTVSITLSGTSSTITTSDGVLSNGQYKVLALGGTPSGTHTITIAPNDAAKIYFVYNTTAQSVVFTQGSGGNVTIAAGDSGIIYSNGAGTGAAVVNLTDHFAMSSANITGGTINGTVIGGTTAAAGTFTTGRFSDNVGLGVTPSAWFSSSKAMQIKSYGSVFESGAGRMSIGFNAFETATNTYSRIQAEAASLYQQVSGQHFWLNAASGTAGTAITFTQAMTLDAAGNVGVGTATPISFGANYQTVQVNGTNGGVFRASNTAATVVGDFYADTLFVGIRTATSVPLTFQTNGVEHVRIHASGGVSVGNLVDPGDNNLSVTGTTATNGITMTGGTQNWTVTASGTNLTFAYNGVNRMRLTSTGDLTVTGNVTAFGTIT